VDAHSACCPGQRRGEFIPDSALCGGIERVSIGSIVERGVGGQETEDVGEE
jgi:hypothetical protein